MDKTPFNEAARLAGIHLNTLRNWQKAGKLKTSEKIIENGRELWIVDPSEVESLSSQHGNKNDNNKAGNIGINNDTSGPEAGPEAVSSPAFEQSLALIRESVVRPLTELVERQSSRIEELSLEVGELRAELRLLKEAHQPVKVPEVATAAQEGPKMVESINYPTPASPPPQAAQEPKKKRRWWQF